jgi:hypothetical protein
MDVNSSSRYIHKSILTCDFLRSWKHQTKQLIATSFPTAQSMVHRLDCGQRLCGYQGNGPTPPLLNDNGIGHSPPSPNTDITSLFVKY